MMQVDEQTELKNQERAGQAAIELHVEELVLYGFSASDRHQLGDAVERELVLLLAEHGIMAKSERAAPRLSAPLIRLGQSAPDTALGQQIAVSVFSALSGMAGSSSEGRAFS